MVRNQDDSSFVSWTATLHPETASSSIDPRLQNTNLNPFVAVFHETCAPDGFDNVPVAIQVIAIDDDDDDEDDIEANPQQPQEATTTNTSQDAAREDYQDSPDSIDPPARPPPSRPQPWKHSNLIDLIVGVALSFTAILWTIKIELTAIIIYTIAAGFQYLADEVLGSAVYQLGKSICMMITSILMIVDAILLTVSVLVTEVLGGVSLIVCSLFGGPRSGKEWHQ